MPTAAEYQALAWRFDDHASELESLPYRFVGRLVPTMLQSAITPVVDGAIEVTGRNLVVAASWLRDLAATCRERAERCRAYTAAVDRYRRGLGDAEPGDVPPRPPMRLAWMEYGR